MTIQFLILLILAALGAGSKKAAYTLLWAALFLIVSTAFAVAWQGMHNWPGIWHPEFTNRVGIWLIAMLIGSAGGWLMKQPRTF